MNGTINELKQGLLKCANENENRTYFTGQVIISSICKSAKDTIEELEQENGQLKAQIEKMKCCGNCKWLERENEYVYCKHTYCAKNLHSKWELKE